MFLRERFFLVSTHFAANIFGKLIVELRLTQKRGGALPIIDYNGRLCPKEVPFSGLRYIKGYGFHALKYRKGLGKLSFRTGIKREFQYISNRRI